MPQSYGDLTGALGRKATAVEGIPQAVPLEEYELLVSIVGEEAAQAHIADRGLSLPEELTDVDIDPATGARVPKRDPLDRALDLEEEQFDWERGLYEEDREKREKLIGGGIAHIGKAGRTADAETGAVLSFLGREYEGLNTPVEPGRFVGGYASRAGAAAADPRAIDAQFETLDELGRRAEGGLTPVEKLMLEMNRRTQERDLRSSREAQMRDLQARGVASSGLEVAGLLGAQQETAQRRMLEDMAASGLAMERSDRALRDRGSLATDVRAGSFDESFKTGAAVDEAQQFNRELYQDHQAYVTDTALKDRERRWGMTQDLGGAHAGAIADKYDRTIAPVHFEANVRSGEYADKPSSSNLVDILKAKEGTRQADAAAATLSGGDDDDGIFGLGFFGL